MFLVFITSKTENANSRQNRKRGFRPTLTALKCWKVATLQFTPLSVNGPYRWNSVFKLDGIKCIWWLQARHRHVHCCQHQKSSQVATQVPQKSCLATKSSHPINKALSQSENGPSPSRKRNKFFLSLCMSDPMFLRSHRIRTDGSLTEVLSIILPSLGGKKADTFPLINVRTDG